MSLIMISSGHDTYVMEDCNEPNDKELAIKFRNEIKNNIDLIARQDDISYTPQTQHTYKNRIRRIDANEHFHAQCNNTHYKYKKTSAFNYSPTCPDELVSYNRTDRFPREVKYAKCICGESCLYNDEYFKQAHSRCESISVARPGKFKFGLIVYFSNKTSLSFFFNI